MSTMKRCISLLLVLCLLLSVVPVTAHAVTASGTCGDNLTWSLSDDGMLTISGTGRMEWYTPSDPAPWYWVRSLISSAVIENGVTTISEHAFYYCDCLSSVEIGNSVELIDDYAFRYCDSLISVEIPDSVMTIGTRAFLGCDSLSNVKIGKGVTTIGERAFSGCYSLSGIFVDGNNPSYFSDDHGVLFNKQENTLLQAPGTIEGTYTIPNSITTIGYAAFDNCNNLSSVEIPNSVTIIDQQAFYSCDGLISVEIPDSVIWIGNAAFAYCSRLKSVKFRGDAPIINYEPFYNVTAIAYYPTNSTTWTAAVRQNYGGKITWTPYDPNHKHEYEAIITAPTCTEQGFTTYTCSCGDTYVSDKVPALGHDWGGIFCQRCDATRENPFNDVDNGSFYIDPVMWAVENGVTSGTSETTFDPSGLCLRAHVVTFLYRAAGSPAPSSAKNPFTDVKSGDFYYNPVLWAVENGITQGISNTQFGSTQACNRAAVVTFLWRAFGSPEPESANNPFADVKTTDFFYKPVLWAVENGITSGVDATHFNPAGNCNRAQVVTFLYRAYN